MYYEKDVVCGVDGMFMWLMEEVGEFVVVFWEGSYEELEVEFVDVFVWLVIIVNVVEVDLSWVVMCKYGKGCLGCDKVICICFDEEKF